MKGLLKALGLAETATEAEAVAKVAEQQTAATTLANEKAAELKAVADERDAAKAAQETLANAKAAELKAVADERDAAKAAFAAERKQRITLVLDNAVAAGRLTAAQVPQWAADLEANLDTKLAELNALKPTVKTAPVVANAQARSAEVLAGGADRQGKILALVNEFTARGLEYTAAFLKVKKEKPELFK